MVRITPWLAHRSHGHGASQSGRDLHLRFIQPFQGIGIVSKNPCMGSNPYCSH